MFYVVKNVHNSVFLSRAQVLDSLQQQSKKDMLEAVLLLGISTYFLIFIEEKLLIISNG